MGNQFCARVHTEAPNPSVRLTARLVCAVRQRVAAANRLLETRSARRIARGKQSRRAEYNRPTASPCWVRMGTIFRCRSRYRFRATPQRKSLVKATRVNSGTGNAAVKLLWQLFRAASGDGRGRRIQSKSSDSDRAIRMAGEWAPTKSARLRRRWNLICAPQHSFVKLNTGAAIYSDTGKQKSARRRSLLCITSH
jgi:hypothetical protein